MIKKQNKTAIQRSNYIDKIRNRIDIIDREIVKLLNKRLEASVSIGSIKDKAKQNVVDIEREKRIIQNIKQANNGVIKNETLIDIYNIIISESRDIQK